jgi:opacity protein-like surface antigen
MKKLFLLLILVAVSVSFAQAATVDTSKGAKALVFQFSGLSTLGVSGYQGEYGLGVRYYIQNNLAIRPGIVLDISKLKNNAVTPAAEIKDTGFGLNLAVEKHIGAASNVSPYLGAEAGFDYSKHTPAGATPVSTKVTDFKVGLLAGFQWGFTDNLSLGGEYMLGATIGKTKTDDTPVTVDASNTEFGISTASVFFSVAW